MSQENVEIVRRWLAAMTDPDPEATLATVSEFWDPTADYYPISKWPEAQPCHGLEEFSRFFARGREAFTRFDSAVRWLAAVGDDRVLACVRLQWEGRGSGITLDGEIYYCYWLRHGRFIRVEDHLTLSGALHALGLEGETLEAAGLSEQDAHADS
jgi:SnoaL-like domain